MIAILFLPCFLFIFGLICTFSKIPPSKKLLSLFFHDLSSHKLIKDDDHSSPDKSDVTRSDRGIINDLTGVFATFDKNNDGYITKQELRESLKNIGISAEERDVSEMVQRVDLNKDGLIDFNEFCELYEDVVNIKGGDDEGDSTNTKDQDLKEAFDVFDENRDGLITVEELGLVLSSLGFSEGKKLEDCREMIRRVDIDGDGMVNFDEFKMMMKSGFGKLVSIS